MTSATETAAASTSATATKAATTAAACARSLGTSFRDRDVATFKSLTVHLIDGSHCFVVAGHFHETKALAATRFAIHDHAGRFNSTELLKSAL